MEKFLIVKGCAGLGNRLYTISNAINYAKLTNRTLLIEWNDGQFSKKGTNAFYDFFNLLEIKNIQSITEIPNLDNKSVFPKVWKNLLKTNLYDNFESASISLFSKLPARLNKYIKPLSMRSGYYRHKENSNKNDFQNLISKKNFIAGGNYSKDYNEDIVVFVDFSPKYYEAIIRNNINLVDSFQNKITTFSLKHTLNKNGIGVHIRYTDKKPDASFDILYSQIDKLNTSDKKLFLSTDNLEIQEMMMIKYPNIIIYPKFLPKEQLEGLHQWALYNNKEDEKLRLFEESIIDMWLLSECSHLIYQANSSFSQTSRILKNNVNCYPW
jgi:hypothetical protein